MTDDLVNRLRDWETVYPEDEDKDDGCLYLEAADRIEDLEAKLAKAKHTLRCVDRRMNDLGGYDGRFSLRKIVSTTLAELTSSEAAYGEAKGGKDE